MGGILSKFCLRGGSITSQTTCTFIVRGFNSRKLVVICGIRQGYPLALMLFILALNSFYRVLQESTDIRGVIIRSGGKSKQIKVSRYADDA